jgi:hypothetical protein
MSGPLIEFVCIAAAHRPRHDGQHASTVTVHLGRWAYCDSPREQDHEWVPSGGVALELLRHRPHGAEARTA